MSTTTTRALLIAGLGINADPATFDISKVEQVLAMETKKLSDNGIFSEHITLDPKDIVGSMHKLEALITTRNWDLFEIGLAVRAPVENTEVFQQAVNLWVEKMPGKRLVFPKGPFDIASAPIRMFSGEDN